MKSTARETKIRCKNCDHNVPRYILRCPQCRHSVIIYWLTVTVFSVTPLLLGIYGYQHLMATKKQVHEVWQQPTPEVITQTVYSQDTYLQIEGYGRVQPLRKIEIRSQIRGKILRVHPKMRSGNFIKKGALLSEIDFTDHENDIEQNKNLQQQLLEKSASLKAKAKYLQQQIKVTESIASLRKELLTQTQTLSSGKIASESELYTREENYLVAVKEINVLRNLHTQLQSEIKTTELTIKNLVLKIARLRKNRKIYAPFSGRITWTNVEVDSRVDSGTLIAIIEDISTLEIPVLLSLTLAKKIFSPTQTFEHLTPNIPAQIMIPNHQTKYCGKVLRFLPLKANHTLPVIVRVDKNHGNFHLQPQALVKVSIQGRKVRNVFVLPTTWLRENNTVHVVENNRLKIRQVNIVHRTRNHMVIDKGLRNRDRVVVLPIDFPVPDMALIAIEDQ